MVILVTAARTSDDESDTEDDMLYSIHDKCNKNSTAYSRKAVPQYGQSKACVSINIRRGRLTLVHPTRVGVKITILLYF